jgi:hypothetical protein
MGNAGVKVTVHSKRMEGGALVADYTTPLQGQRVRELARFVQTGDKTIAFHFACPADKYEGYGALFQQYLAYFAAGGAPGGKAP